MHGPGVMRASWAPAAAPTVDSRIVHARSAKATIGLAERAERASLPAHAGQVFAAHAGAHTGQVAEVRALQEEVTKLRAEAAHARSAKAAMGQVEHAERAPLPVHAGQAAEVRALQEEIAKLKVEAQRDASEREELTRSLELLKAELRRALDENRALTDALEERKLLLAEATAREQAAARENALDSARAFFKSMLASSEGDVGGKRQCGAPAGFPGRRRQNALTASAQPAR
uniref:Uncharacterized protein n=1 Tax=Alexandrium monilatum TaxID=311494 RepID=A0A7S4QAA2_9DINO|mmetsp:Transcript_53179/g.158449  ORF Transcript_53179/g.158449 Transcript_53179/m.158449 type:complete len:231 (+) Transcript_53179:38-730(+)